MGTQNPERSKVLSPDSTSFEAHERHQSITILYALTQSETLDREAHIHNRGRLMGRGLSSPYKLSSTDLSCEFWDSTAMAISIMQELSALCF